MNNPSHAVFARVSAWRGGLAGAVLAAGALTLAPGAHAADAEVTEGDRIEFIIKLGAAPNGWAMRYKYRTQDVTADAGDDYLAATGRVTFSSGETEKKVTVTTIDDDDDEFLETFKLKLYDQEVNGLYRGVTGWTDSTIVITGMPMNMTMTGQIKDNDSSNAGAKGAGN